MLAWEYPYVRVKVEGRDGAYTCFWASAIYAGLAGAALMYLYDSKAVPPERQLSEEDEDSEESALIN